MEVSPNITSFIPVSYTHLKQIEKKIDVIQAHYFTEDEIYFHEIALYKVSTPAVSYTHLDVYKRQIVYSLYATVMYLFSTVSI